MTTKESDGIDHFSCVPEGFLCNNILLMTFVDVVIQIFKYLPVLGPISCTCRRLERLSKHESLWGPFITHEEVKIA
jgi:hypothetical protein